MQIKYLLFQKFSSEKTKPPERFRPEGFALCFLSYAALLPPCFMAFSNSCSFCRCSAVSVVGT